MRIIKLMVGVFSVFCAGLLFAADADKDLATFEGTWTLSSGEAEGKPLTEKQLKGGKLMIKDGQYSVTMPDKDVVTGTQKIDSTKTPKQIDITDYSGPSKGKTHLGIYEFKEGEFRCVFSAAGQDRPSKFSTGSGQWLHVWKKAK